MLNIQRVDGISHSMGTTPIRMSPLPRCWNVEMLARRLGDAIEHNFQTDWLRQSCVPPYTIIAEDECLYWEVHLGFFGLGQIYTPRSWIMKLGYRYGMIWQCFCLKASQISGQSQFRLSKLRFHQIDIKRLHTIQRLLHPLNSAQSVFCWPSEAE